MSQRSSEASEDPREVAFETLTRRAGFVTQAFDVAGTWTQALFEEAVCCETLLLWEMFERFRTLELEPGVLWALNEKITLFSVDEISLPDLENKLSTLGWSWTERTRFCQLAVFLWQIRSRLFEKLPMSAD